MPRRSRIATYVISLDQDGERRAAILKDLRLQPVLKPIIVPATNGMHLPDAVCLSLTGRASWARRKGTIGCFLSHVRAWEMIAALSEPFGVVVEDDAEVESLYKVARLDLPRDSELVFLNHRMSSDPHAAAPPRAEPLVGALKRLDALHLGGGTDGYLLTPIGARKLVAACADELYFGHVDGRLMRYGASEADLEALGPESWLSGVIRNQHACQGPPPIGVVRAYCVTPPLVTHGRHASTREAFDSRVQTAPERQAA